MAVSTGLIDNILNDLQLLLQKFDAFAISGEPITTHNSPYQGRLDEIGDLHRGFDWMTRVWTRVNHEKEEQRHLLQEKQIQQLRAQSGRIFYITLWNPSTAWPRIWRTSASQ